MIILDIHQLPYSETFIENLIFHGGLLLSTFLLLILFLLWRAYENKKRSNISLRVKNKEVEAAHQDIEEKNKILQIRNRELKEAKEKAESASRAKQDFLSNMSHEIRTPLNAVIGMTDILRMENPRPDQQEALESIHFSGKSLLRLINDILDLTKIEEGKIVLEKVPFNINELLNHIKNTFTGRAEAKGLRFSVQVDGNIPGSLRGDPFRLSQILNNLIDNAIKFTEKGNVILKTELENIESKNVTLRFRVKDTGIGISEEEQSRIFRRFEQASSSTTRKYGGSGLGLTIISHLLNLHNSKIHLKSKPGEGTEFLFSLHFMAGDTDTLSGKSLKEEKIIQKPETRIKVLLVEDNELNMKLADKFLCRLGFRVDKVTNGLQAVEKCRENTYELILMDLHMPVMDGWEATRQIRKIKPYKDGHIPILAITADVMSENDISFSETGLNGYISKPFSFTELKTKIGRFFDLKIPS